MKFLLLNQTFYPDVVATAQVLKDLALGLVKNGHEVTVLCGQRAYDAVGKSFPKVERWNNIQIHRVGSLGLGKSAKWKRAIDFASFFLTATSKALNLPRQDVVVALTSPPLISVLGALLAKRWRASFFYWIMDLNPDEAIAAGWLRPGSFVAKVLDKISRFSLQQSKNVIVLDRFMKERIKAKGIESSKIKVLPPWSHDDEVRFDSVGRDKFRKTHGLENKFVVMYSGNHSPCHPLDTLLAAAKQMGSTGGPPVLFGDSPKNSTLKTPGSNPDGNAMSDESHASQTSASNGERIKGEVSIQGNSIGVSPKGLTLQRSTPDCDPPESRGAKSNDESQASQTFLSASPGERIKDEASIQGDSIGVPPKGLTLQCSTPDCHPTDSCGEKPSDESQTFLSAATGERIKGEVSIPAGTTFISPAGSAVGLRPSTFDTSIVFCFIGGGSEFARVKNFASRHGLKNIRCLPYQPLNELAGSLSAADLHVVVMGEKFLGTIHPCKIYNILLVGSPVLLIGPRPSHVSEVLDKMDESCYGIVAHGDTEGAMEQIQRFQRIQKPERDLQLFASTAARFSKQKILPELLEILEGTEIIPEAAQVQHECELKP